MIAKDFEKLAAQHSLHHQNIGAPGFDELVRHHAELVLRAQRDPNLSQAKYGEYGVYGVGEPEGLKTRPTVVEARGGRPAQTLGHMGGEGVQVGCHARPFKPQSKVIF